MNVITHVLMGWAVAERSGLEHRERSILAWASVAPDLDGLGLLLDLGNRVLESAESFFYAEWHHRILHGLPGAFVIAAVSATAARVSRVRVGVLAFVLVHLHLACDLIGSRGPTPDDIWPINYLAPLLSVPTLSWSHQWALNAWPNIALTLVLLAYGFVRAVRVGHSPVSLFNRAANAVFVQTVRQRWATMRGAA